MDKIIPDLFKVPGISRIDFRSGGGCFQPVANIMLTAGMPLQVDPLGWEVLQRARRCSFINRTSTELLWSGPSAGPDRLLFTTLVRLLR